jgi:eukaryotic-like serine/threonine-protein kinase
MNERDIFIAALQLESSAARQAYLDDACGDDETLRHQVESLLDTHARVGSFLQEPVIGSVSAAAVLEQLARVQPATAVFPRIGPFGEKSTEPLSLAFLAPPQQLDELGRLGHYRVLRLLGQGGMGIVFLADDSRLQRPVALKVMRPELAANPEGRQRFLREARAAAHIRSDHIVSIYQVDEDNNVPFLAMEFLEGESLDERLHRQGSLPLADVLRIGRELAEGLEAAHERGLIHRDIKPANVWLEGKRGRVKILDFGLARPIHQGDMHLTQSGTIVGTPAYMAPEQAQGHAVGPASDLFSLGVVLYHLCTGDMPFHANNTTALLIALAMEVPRPPKAVNPKVPAPLSDLVMKLLEKDPAQRPASASAVVRTLKELDKKSAPERPAAEKSETLTAITPQCSVGNRTGRDRGQAMAPVLPRRRFRANIAIAVAVAAGFGALTILAGGIVIYVLTNNRGIRGDTNDPQAQKTLPKAEVAVPLKPAWRPEDKGLPKEFANSLGMRLMRIPAGQFQMGSPPEEIERCVKSVGPNEWAKDDVNSEGPQHEVDLVQPFYMGATEVTVGQFRQFVTEQKYQVGDDRWQKPDFEQADDQPVVFVTWQNAVDFCAWLSAKEGNKYRLPTEAEWEYCCRAGKAGTQYCFGNETASLGSYAWYNANSGGKTHPVGQLKANAWGLFDMHGNAYEWCQDLYDRNYYKTSPRENPPGPTAGFSNDRVVRGGTWHSQSVYCRSAYRRHYAPGSRDHLIGFRVLLLVSSPGGVRP